MKTWYKVTNAAEGDAGVAEIAIFDFIGDWIDELWKWDPDSGPVTAASFVRALAELPAGTTKLRVRINSPGGDVWGAVAIANALRAWATGGRTVETVVDGLAASAASVVMMAGDPIRVADNGLVMIHNPWTGTMGDAGEMRKAADMLDQIKATLVSTYQWHSEASAEEIAAMMDAETWMTADEAIAAGLADEKIAGLRAAASIDPRAVAKLRVPEQHRARVEALVLRPEAAPEPRTEPAAPITATLEPAAAMAVCRELGLDLDFVAGLLAPGRIVAADPLAEARALATEERDRRAADTERRSGIVALCRKHKLDNLAAGMQASGMSLADAGRHIAEIVGLLDQVQTDGGLLPDAGAAPAAKLSPAEIYAARRA